MFLKLEFLMQNYCRVNILIEFNLLWFWYYILWRPSLLKCNLQLTSGCLSVKDEAIAKLYVNNHWRIRWQQNDVEVACKLTTHMARSHSRGNEANFNSILEACNHLNTSEEIYLTYIYDKDSLLLLYWSIVNFCSKLPVLMYISFFALIIFPIIGNKDAFMVSYP